jgi:hypothetical protein
MRTVAQMAAQNLAASSAAAASRQAAAGPSSASRGRLVSKGAAEAAAGAGAGVGPVESPVRALYGFGHLSCAKLEALVKQHTVGAVLVDSP